MTQINYAQPVKLEEMVFDVTLDRARASLPSDIQERVDAHFKAFSDKAVKEGREPPTKGENCVLSTYQTLPNGLEGTCSIATYDEVVYFARSQIPEQDYQFGRTKVGFPLASWGVLVSTDNNLLFARKKGTERAYEGQPFSAFGALVSTQVVEKEGERERVAPRKFLEGSVGREVGKAVWERVTGINYLGLNVYDENSAKVNNGYDTVWRVSVDAQMAQIMALLEENPQFVPASARYVAGNPTALREFASANPMSSSGLPGIFSYIGSIFGQDELLKQYALYRQARGKDAVDLTFCAVQ